MSVRAVAYAGGRPVDEVAVADISEVLRQPDRFVWVGLHEPDAALLRRVQEEFGLHDLAVEDALRAHQRPKLERYGDSIFVVLRTARRAAGRLERGETHLFVGPRYLVSVHHGPAIALAEVRARWEASPEHLALGPGFVLYAMMDFIVDQYFPVVDSLEDDLEALEEAIFRATFRRETAARIYRLKRDLLEVKRAVSPLVDVSNQLTRFDSDLVPAAIRPYFRDVYDHVIRINDLVDTLRELATSALEAHLSLISVAQNDAMKRLAGWAAIIAVPTMIAGIYGMNFQFMPELQWPWGYPAAMLVMAGVCLYLYRRFKRAGWL